MDTFPRPRRTHLSVFDKNRRYLNDSSENVNKNWRFGYTSEIMDKVHLRF